MRVSDTFLLFCDCTLNVISNSDDSVLACVVLKNSGNNTYAEFSNVHVNKSNLFSLVVTDIYSMGSGIVDVYVDC